MFMHIHTTASTLFQNMLLNNLYGGANLLCFFGLKKYHDGFISIVHVFQLCNFCSAHCLVCFGSDIFVNMVLH